MRGNPYSKTTLSETGVMACGTFAAEFLGAFGVIPDIALGQFVFYFFETLNFVGVVKDTPSARQYALKGL